MTTTGAILSVTQSPEPTETEPDATPEATRLRDDLVRRARFLHLRQHVHRPADLGVPAARLRDPGQYCGAHVDHPVCCARKHHWHLRRSLGPDAGDAPVSYT